MAFFKKKEQPKSNVDQALELFGKLTDEELEEFLSRADLEKDEGDEDETTEQIEKAEENIEAKALEKEDDEKPEENIEAKALEKEDDEKPEETSKEEELEREEKEQDVFRAFEARLDEIEERIANIVSKLDGGDFGNHSAEITEQESKGETEDSRIMNSYMRKQAFRR